MPEPLYQFINLADLEAFKEEFETQNNGAFGTHLMISQNATTGVVTFKLYSADNTLLDEKTLDLDTEHIIKSVSLDYAHKQLIFTMSDNTTLTCDISTLIDTLTGLITTLQQNINNGNIDVITNNDLDEVFPDLEPQESESE